MMGYKWHNKVALCCTVSRYILVANIYRYMYTWRTYVYAYIYIHVFFKYILCIQNVCCQTMPHEHISYRYRNIHYIHIDIFTHVHRKLQYINCPKTGEDSHRLKAFELKYNSFPPRIRSKSPLYKVYMGLIKGTIPKCPPFSLQVPSWCFVSEGSQPSDVVIHKLVPNYNTRPQNGPLFPFSFSNPDKRLCHTIYDPGLVFFCKKVGLSQVFWGKHMNSHEHLVDWFWTQFLPNWLGWLEAWFSPIHLRWGYEVCISQFLHLGIQPQEEKPALSVLFGGISTRSTWEFLPQKLKRTTEKT